MSRELKQVINALVRGFRFTAALLEAILRENQEEVKAK
jgi:hypothetical protein